MKRILLTVFLFSFLFLSLQERAFAGPGDYTLRVKGGPAFNLQDWQNQGRVGGEFDYDLGYSMGFVLSSYFGISDTFRLDLLPNLRYNYVYIGPASLHVIFGVGYTIFETNNALSFRVGTGLSLPLGDTWEFQTDAHIYVSPVGATGTPMTLDWVIGFGRKFF